MKNTLLRCAAIVAVLMATVETHAAVIFQEDWNSGAISGAAWINEGSDAGLPFVYDLGLTGQGSSGDFALFLRDSSFGSDDGIRSVMNFNRTNGSQGIRASFKLFRDGPPALNDFATVAGPWSDTTGPAGTFPILENIEAGISRDESNQMYYVEGSPANWATTPLTAAFRNAFIAATTKANALDVSVTLGNSTGAKIEWSVGGGSVTTEFDTIGQVAGTNWGGGPNVVSSTNPVRLFFGGVGNGTSHASAIVDDIVVTGIPEPTSGVMLMLLVGMLTGFRPRRIG